MKLTFPNFFVFRKLILFFDFSKIQIRTKGLVVHAMGGFDHQKAAKMIGLKDVDDYTIEAMVAIGNKAKNGAIEKTTQRNEIEKFTSENVFTEKIV